MSIEGQIHQRVSKEIGYEDIEIVAHPCESLDWPIGLGAQICSNLGFVVVNDTFWKLDHDACIFSVKHEIGHYRNHEWENKSKTFFKILKCAVPLLGLGGIYKSQSSALFKVMGVAMTSIFSYCFNGIGEGVVSRQKEYWADSYAIQNSTNEELRGGLRFFKALNQSHCMVNGEEENSWVSTHPLSMSRYNNVVKELQRRGEDPALNAEDELQIKDLAYWELLDGGLSIAKEKKELFDDFKRRRLSELNVS